jgi:putative oxidoreductase
MKYLPNIAGVLLGLMFILASTMVLFHWGPSPEPPPAGSPPGLFMAALVPTGYLTFIKIIELAGGIMVMIPKLRNIGLLFLGPVIVNILAFHIFLLKGAGLGDPMLIGICLLAVYLLWADRQRWAALIR